jgi:enterochelin esterase-like enzyme
MQCTIDFVIPTSILHRLEAHVLGSCHVARVEWTLSAPQVFTDSNDSVSSKQEERGNRQDLVMVVAQRVVRRSIFRCRNAEKRLQHTGWESKSERESERENRSRYSGPD